MKKYRINRMVVVPFFVGGQFAQGNYKPNEGFYFEVNDKGEVWAKHETNPNQDMLTILQFNTLDIWNGQGIISRI